MSRNWIRELFSRQKINFIFFTKQNTIMNSLRIFKRRNYFFLWNGCSHWTKDASFIKSIIQLNNKKKTLNIDFFLFCLFFSNINFNTLNFVFYLVQSYLEASVRTFAVCSKVVTIAATSCIFEIKALSIIVVVTVVWCMRIITSSCINCQRAFFWIRKTSKNNTFFIAQSIQNWFCLNLLSCKASINIKNGVEYYEQNQNKLHYSLNMCYWTVSIDRSRKTKFETHELLWIYRKNCME